MPDQLAQADSTRGPVYVVDAITNNPGAAGGVITTRDGRLLGVIGACRINTIVSGGTGSGKTTLLNCLTAFIDPAERTITCEDSAELQLQQPHVVRLETRPPNLEGAGAITMRDLVKNCLRMRPERIIVGEVRGPEALDLISALNTGHRGSMSTIHANSPDEAMWRLETLALSAGNVSVEVVSRQLFAAVTAVVQLERRGPLRRVSEIAMVSDA